MGYEVEGVAFVTYALGYLGWIALWRALVGFDVLGRLKLMYIPFLGAQVVFLANMFLAIHAKIPDYATELQLYPYVENNAKTVSGLSLAIAVFVVVRFDSKVEKIMDQPTTKLFLWCIFWSFIFAVVGCLPLYWMPPGKYWLTTLRHLKTVPYIYSLFILVTGIISFLYGLGYRQDRIVGAMLDECAKERE